MFPGHKRSNFDHSAAIFPLKSDLILLKVRKISKNYKTSNELSPSKCFSGHEQCSFHTPVVKFSAEVKILLCSMFKKISKKYPYQQNYISSECLQDTRTTFLVTPLKDICDTPNTFFHSECQTDGKNLIVFFEKNLIALGMFQGTGGMQFWQPWPKTLIKSKFCLLKFGKNGENYRSEK